MRLCSVEGCGRKHNARGLCSMHGMRKMRAENPDAGRLAVRKFRGIVGATGEARQGPCPICRVDGPLGLDHCAQTGRIRGWLCSKCNVGIGLLGDTLELVESAARYLRGL